MSEHTTPTSHLQPGTIVRAVKNIITKNRTMKAGTTGRVVMRWAYLAEIRPDGKKLTVEVSDMSALEVVK